MWNWHDYDLSVKCNQQPEMRVSVVAENKGAAIKYAKEMYAAEYTTYADDRANKWQCELLWEEEV